MGDVKPEEAPVVAAPVVPELVADDVAPFFHLWITRDGGLNFELNMSNMPDKSSGLIRMVGNCHLALWQLIEWATVMVRGSEQAKREAEQALREMLERLPDDATPN
jgi:hypothetical protein